MDCPWAKEHVEKGLKLFATLGIGGMNTRGMGRLKVLNLEIEDKKEVAAVRMPEVVNLEQECARYAIEIASSVREVLEEATDVLITKTLGVLQEQGLYALALFCAAASDKEREGVQK